MAQLDPRIGAPLTFDEVKRLVEAASPAVELRDDPEGKGRYLVAKRALKSGEVVLSEHTLFCGRTDALQSSRACKAEFVALADAITDEGREAEYEDEDCMHPCSPLVDCIAGILFTKAQALHSEDKSTCARAKLKMRQFAALARTCVTEPMSDEGAQEFLDIFLPELRNLVDKDELREMMKSISSNRFSGLDQQLDLMFAGSMFEHSCVPNCFAGNWRRSAKMPRLYRALEDIEVGQALSISYIQLPEIYLPTSGRNELLGSWGFQCACPRCTCLPELSRAFVCPACSAPQLCPSRPRADANAQEPGAEVQELRCCKCGKSADAAYAAQCFKLEDVLDKLSRGVEVSMPSGGESNDVIGRFHHAAFQESWRIMQEGPSPDTLDRYGQSVEELIQCVTHLNGDPRHPNLLELYHVMASLMTGDLESQQHYLELERATLVAHYPEEVEKQDQEIWNLVQGKGPHTALPENGFSDLSNMD